MLPLHFKISLNISKEMKEKINKDNDLKSLVKSFSIALEELSSNITLVTGKSKTDKPVEHREAISELYISKRSQNALIKKGIIFVDQLEDYTIDDLVNIKGVGEQAINSIKEKVSLKESIDENLSEFAKIGFPTKLENLLNKHGFHTPEDLKNAPVEHIKAIKGIGKSSKKLILDYLGIKNLPESRKRVSVKNLGFSTKIVNSLINAGINTERQLLAVKNIERLRTQKGFGPQAIKSLKEYIKNATVEVQGVDIKNLGFSTRGQTVLSKNGIFYIDQLKQMTFEQVRNMQGVGNTILFEIINALEYGNAYPENIQKKPRKNRDTTPSDKSLIEENISDKNINESISEKVESSKEESDFEEKIYPNKKHTLDILKVVGLKPRILNKLSRGNQRFVEDIMDKTEKDFSCMVGISENSVPDILQALDKFKELNIEDKEPFSHYFIKDLGLEKRLSDKLINSGILFADQLIKMSDNEITEIQGISKASLGSIKDSLTKIA